LTLARIHIARGCVARGSTASPVEKLDIVESDGKTGAVTRGIRTPSLLISAQVLLGTCLQMGRLGVRIALAPPPVELGEVEVCVLVDERMMNVGGKSSPNSSKCARVTMGKVGTDGSLTYRRKDANAQALTPEASAGTWREGGRLGVRISLRSRRWAGRSLALWEQAWREEMASSLRARLTRRRPTGRGSHIHRARQRERG